ncbi:MAG TPA: hypothetical protein VN635_02745 [Conexibacter sp.]|nr:hypothetical protein [Conexibacter sp.]
MSAHARHLMRSLTIAVVVCVVALVAAAMDASAYYTASGTASASASVGTLAAPSIASATFSGPGSVSLSWSAVTAPASGSVAYYVSRDGGPASAACPGSAAPASVTSCTDTGLAAGAHSYTVTAVWRSWTHASASTRVVVSYGVATQLVFTTPPGGGATGGTAFPTQPAVTAEDAAGNAVLSYAGTVGLSILRGGAGGATLAGCSGALRNGVTTFSGCTIDKAGSAYYLHASDGTLGGDSPSFDVAVGAVAQLVFTTPPSGATGGSAFTTQPIVTAQDAGGNPVTGYAGTVALSIASGTGTSGATLSGCSGSLRNGVTSFGGCKIDKVGTAYKLHASDARLAVDSAAFDVTPGVAARLVFSIQPSGATGGTAFTTQPVVTALDAGGNTATSYAGTVTLSIASGGAGGAALSGCTSSLRSGVTTFSGCKIDKVGTSYVLQARDGTLSVTSSAFNVTAGPATRLVFSTQPGGVARNSVLNPQPVITALDAGGNVATGYAGTVALSLSTNPSNASLNNCSASLSNGVTTFSGCRVNKAGTGYVLQASDGALSVNSNPFNVS